MPCCTPKPNFDEFFDLEKLGYITMKVEIVKEYKGLKVGQDVSDLPDAQKKLLLSIKAAKLTTTTKETKKDVKKDNSKRSDSHSDKPKSEG